MKLGHCTEENPCEGCKNIHSRLRNIELNYITRASLDLSEHATENYIDRKLIPRIEKLEKEQECDNIRFKNLYNDVIRNLEQYEKKLDRLESLKPKCKECGHTLP